MPSHRRKRNDARRTRARGKLVAQGLGAIGIGLLLLTIVPLAMPARFAAGIGMALRPAGWGALLLGAVLLLLHYVVQRLNPIAAVDDKSAPARMPSLPSAVMPRQTHWSPAVLAAIEWRRFEALCEAFYAQAGLTTRSQSHGADGGVDIWLQSKHMTTPRIVQCKHWQGKQVGVREMREFLGVMASHQLQSSTYVTSSTFTADAMAFAKANGIQLQDGAALLKLVGQRTPEQQTALLAVAYEGEYWKPTCASCGIKTVRKERKRDGNAFWGCSNYPRCKTIFALHDI